MFFGELFYGYCCFCDNKITRLSADSLIMLYPVFFASSSENVLTSASCGMSSNFRRKLEKPICMYAFASINVGLAFLTSLAYSSMLFMLWFLTSVIRSAVLHLKLWSNSSELFSCSQALGISGRQILLKICLLDAQREMYSCVGSWFSFISLSGRVPLVTRKTVKFFCRYILMSSLMFG